MSATAVNLAVNGRSHRVTLAPGATLLEAALVDAAEHRSLGAGECAAAPTVAAIANAVAHALGTRIRDLPLVRERILSGLSA